MRKIKKEKLEKEVFEALYKKAIGYDCDEEVFEYVVTDGENKLIRKKVTRKHVPPDIPSAKLLLERISTGESFSDLSDEDLEKEKQRLLKILKEAENDKKNVRYRRVPKGGGDNSET